MPTKADPLVGERRGGFMSKKSCNFFSGVVRPSCRAVILSEGFAGDAVESPFRRPVKAPGQFSFTFGDVRHPFNAVSVPPMHHRVFVPGDDDTVERTFGIKGLPREPILRQFTPRYAFYNFTNRSRFVTRPLGCSSKLAGLVGLQIRQQFRLNTDLSQGIEKRREKVVAVTPPLVLEPAPIGMSVGIGCRDGAELMADEGLIVVAQERVDFA